MSRKKAPPPLRYRSVCPALPGWRAVLLCIGEGSGIVDPAEVSGPSHERSEGHLFECPVVAYAVVVGDGGEDDAVFPLVFVPHHAALVIPQDALNFVCLLGPGQHTSAGLLAEARDNLGRRLE